MCLTLCLPAAVSTGHQPKLLSAGTPNCTSCVWRALSDCQTLTLAGSTLVSCILHSTAAIEAGYAARLCILARPWLHVQGMFHLQLRKGFRRHVPSLAPYLS